MTGATVREFCGVVVCVVVLGCGPNAPRGRDEPVASVCDDSHELPGAVSANQDLASGAFNRTADGRICFNGWEDTCGSTIFKKCVHGLDFTYCPSPYQQAEFGVIQATGESRPFCR